MEAFLGIKIGIYNTWILSLIYFVTSMGLLALFPKYNISKFIKTPGIKYITQANYILYYGFLFFSIFIPIKTGTMFFYIGTSFYTLGLILYTLSMFYFAISEYDKPVTEKVYKISRHPVYLSYFLISIGISISGASIILCIIAILHFISTYFIAKEEEKKCIEIYGSDYLSYMKKVRMFL
ncbi:MAG: hypothetical protein L3J35_12585 [Bacteroidales bacterium]|nr:hypothetical protein [Bacteroidales bacterium]